jgi:NADH:ubiquinone oxidoreductase subunit 2 (subunit N)
LSALITLAQDGKETLAPINYPAILPMLIILGAACVGVLFEAFLPRHQRWQAQVFLTLLALVGAGLAMAVYITDAPSAGELTLANTIAVDRPALFLWGTLLALALGSVLMIADRSVEPGGAFVAQAAIRPGTMQDREQRLGAHPARRDAARFQMQTEVFPLTLFALGGMMVFCSANDLLTMFVSLEVLSLPLYLMCGLARRRRLLSQEAAVKYFLLGAFASAFFLYGLALLYGYAGSVRLADIANAAAGSDRSDTLLFGGMALLIVGLLFKGSVGPFHAWTPDVYQGAPTPITAFMAACTKVAAFGGILRVLSVGLESTQWEWRGVLWGVAIVSMVIGAVLGLTQTDIKRMIAYSSIAHAGFLLIGAIVLTAGRLVDAVLPAGVRLHHGGHLRRHLAGPRRRRRGDAPVPVGRPGETVAPGGRGVHVPVAGPGRHTADVRLHRQVRGVLGRAVRRHGPARGHRPGGLGGGGVLLPAGDRADVRQRARRGRPDGHRPGRVHDGGDHAGRGRDVAAGPDPGLRPGLGERGQLRPAVTAWW